MRSLGALRQLFFWRDRETRDEKGNAFTSYNLAEMFEPIPASYRPELNVEWPGGSR
jgi:hypothetical protein